MKALEPYSITTLNFTSIEISKQLHDNRNPLEFNMDLNMEN